MLAVPISYDGGRSAAIFGELPAMRVERHTDRLVPTIKIHLHHAAGRVMIATKQENGRARASVKLLNLGGVCSTEDANGLELQNCCEI